jgi:hypothetical protein
MSAPAAADDLSRVIVSTTTPSPRKAPAISNARLDQFARGLVVFVMLALMTLKYRPIQESEPQFLIVSVLGGFVAWLAYRPSLRQVAAVFATALGIAAIFAAWGRANGLAMAAWPIWLMTCCGLALLVVLGVQAARKTEALTPFMLAMFCPVLITVVAASLEFAIPLQPLVYDYNLFHADLGLGGSFTFMAGKWLWQFKPLFYFCLLVYGSLPVAMVFGFVRYLRKPEDFSLNLVSTVILAGIVGYAYYQICPGLGPYYVYGKDFPFGWPQSTPWGPIAIPLHPRNAMPSLHAGWVLLLWWNLRRQPRWLRVSSAVYVFFTLLATQGFGEHYFVDLIAAVPFAVAMQAIGQKRYLEAAPALAWTAAFTVWLRLASSPQWTSAPVVWTMTAVTAALSTALVVRLERARDYRETRIAVSGVLDVEPLH